MNKRIIIVMILFMYGCNSCFKDLYGVHTPSPRITFSLDFNNISILKFDSILLQLEKGNCKKNGIIPKEDHKIICLETTCNCFLVKRIEKKLIVYGVYSPSLKNFWITNEVEIEDTVLNNLKQELRNEIEKEKLK